MPTIEQCINCPKKCPQGELAHQTALGRMYATNELVDLVRKIDSGQLVEVVRCKDCKRRDTVYCAMDIDILDVADDMFCSFGERREAEHE